MRERSYSGIPGAIYKVAGSYIVCALPGDVRRWKGLGEMGALRVLRELKGKWLVAAHKTVLRDHYVDRV